jgi:hypothetical protein
LRLGATIDPTGIEKKTTQHRLVLLCCFDVSAGPVRGSKSVLYSFLGLLMESEEGSIDGANEMEPIRQIQLEIKATR